MALVVPTPRETADIAVSDGARIRLRRHGNPAGPRLVVSHGNGFAVDGYFPFWRLLLDDFDLVVFDLRNHGRNPLAEPANHDYAQMARDLDDVHRGVAEAFGARPAIGVFHSLSAQAAIKQAIELGWRWEALVLFDPPNVPAPGHRAHAAIAAYQDRLEAWALQRRERFADPAELARDYAATRVMKGWVAGAHALMARTVLRPEPAQGDFVLCCPRALEASIYRQANTLGLWPPRRRLAGPVALIAADPAMAHPAPSALSNRDFAAELGYDHFAIPGTGHLMQLEQPRACVAAMRAFLRANRLDPG